MDVDLPDDLFLDGFFAGTLPDCPHRDHVRLTWLLLRRHGQQAALPLVLEGLARFAAAKGNAARFDAGLTRAWVSRLAEAMEDGPEGETFDAFVARNPAGLGKG